MSDRPDVVEQDLVLVVNPLVERLNRVIPEVGLWHMVGHEADVLEVGVLDVLHQPVLGPCQLVLRHWSFPLVKPAKEICMLGHVAVNVVP